MASDALPDFAAAPGALAFFEVLRAHTIEGMFSDPVHGGNRDFAVRELPGLNHLFQTATTGAPSEYATIEETFAPAAMDTIVQWVQTHTASHP